MLFMYENLKVGSMSMSSCIFSSWSCHPIHKVGMIWNQSCNLTANCGIHCLELGENGGTKGSSKVDLYHQVLNTAVRKSELLYCGGVLVMKLVYSCTTCTFLNLAVIHLKNSYQILMDRQWLLTPKLFQWMTFRRTGLNCLMSHIIHIYMLQSGLGEKKYQSYLVKSYLLREILQGSIFSLDLHWYQMWQNLDQNWLTLANWLRSHIPVERKSTR